MSEIWLILVYETLLNRRCLLTWLKRLSLCERAFFVLNFNGVDAEILFDANDKKLCFSGWNSAKTYLLYRIAVLKP